MFSMAEKVVKSTNIKNRSFYMCFRGTRPKTPGRATKTRSGLSLGRILQVK